MPSLPSGVQSSETQRKVYQSRGDVILSETPKFMSAFVKEIIEMSQTI